MGLGLGLELGFELVTSRWASKLPHWQQCANCDCDMARCVFSHGLSMARLRLRPSRCGGCGSRARSTWFGLGVGVG